MAEGAEVKEVKKDDELFNCKVCFEKMFRPQVNACGHTFCRPCCEQLKECALCRAPMKYTTNFQLEHIIQQSDPGEYERLVKKHRVLTPEEMENEMKLSNMLILEDTPDSVPFRDFCRKKLYEFIKTGTLDFKTMHKHNVIAFIGKYTARYSCKQCYTGSYRSSNIWFADKQQFTFFCVRVPCKRYKD